MSTAMRALLIGAPCGSERGGSAASAVDLGAGEPAPDAVDEALDRPEARLVGHLAAVADPVAEVEVGQAERAALLDLPEDVEGAEARSLELRVEERVDRGEPVGQEVDDAHHHELRLVAELDEPGVDPALQQKVRVLVAAVLVHAAARVARCLIAQVERVVLDAEPQAERGRREAVVLPPRAPLVARRLELAHRNPYRHAGTAGIAVRPIGEDAAAAKAEPYQLGVEIVADEVRGRRHLRAGHLARQVATWVRGSHVELQYRMRQIVELRHLVLVSRHDARGHIPSRSPRSGKALPPASAFSLVRPRREPAS